MSFPFYNQLESMDCGPTCLRMIAKYHGKNYSLPFLREKCYIDKGGVSLKGISEAAELIGLKTLAVKIPLVDQADKPSLMSSPMPSILHWNQNHFVVIYKINKKYAWIADPARGKYRLTLEELSRSWQTNGQEKAIALILEPSNEFYSSKLSGDGSKGFRFLFLHLKPYQKMIVQLILGLLVGTVFQLLFPFLTQSLVDIGIDTRNLNFIHLVLVGQLMLFVGQTVVQFIQNWILLHISVRINVSLITDFLLKLMQLPLGFFDSKNTGDLLQRIDDHKRIGTFLNQTSLSILLSLINILAFGIVLAIYSIPIFLIFLTSSVLYLSWIAIFLKKRKEVDYRAFQQMSDEQDALLEIIHGMPEIKLEGSQLKRRWKWSSIQAQLFRTQKRSLEITQYQDAGAFSINQFKDIIITFVAATSVLNGTLTLGMMLAIQYIIGQLNGPLLQLIGFIRRMQDARIGFERMSEIQNLENEEKAEDQSQIIIPSGDISMNNLSFKYTGIGDLILEDINLKIPRGKTTAIVGSSGSGKTTLLKLLLGFYKPTKGEILVGNQSLENIYKKIWRAECGVVMQEGFIFSDTISANIAESDDQIDLPRVVASAKTANIIEFIESLPLGFSTVVGKRGNGLSQGQKQRLLIARAVYKNPQFIFFDEATNALDAINESMIMNNLDQFMKDRTAVIVAHRLSTVKNADQIVVLEKGRIVEIGTHEDLVKYGGKYFNLVKNQLELGNDGTE